MGLTIHYSGNINDYSRLNELTEEVKDICENMGWKYHVWENEHPRVNKKKPSLEYSPENLKGISFTPEKSETLSLTFLPNGRLFSFTNFMIKEFEKDDAMLHSNFIKTQYAGPDVHIALIKLMKYLDKKYLLNLKVIDEGLYWETNDEKVLLNQFKKYDLTIKAFEGILTDFKSEPNETSESLADRLQKFLSGKLPPKGFEAS